MSTSLPLVRPCLRSEKERFMEAGKDLDMSLLDFWQWQGSNLLDNALRGILAEFLVARALNCNKAPRVEWDGCDCRTPEGLRVEVKSSAYIQSWGQKQPSRISFDIAPKQAWNAATNGYSSERKRHSDVYVFCLYAHTDQESANPLDLSQWKFYVLPTRALDKKAPIQKTITLSSLLDRFAPPNPSYADLAKTIRQATNAR